MKTHALIFLLIVVAGILAACSGDGYYRTQEAKRAPAKSEGVAHDGYTSDADIEILDEEVRFLGRDVGHRESPRAKGLLEPDEVVVIERDLEEDGDIDIFFEGRRALPEGGALMAKFEAKTVPLPLEHTDVEAEIALHVASVRVTQQYQNPYDEKIEAVYVFPLPQNAAVTDFLMKIGDRTIRGIIREKEEARRIYEAAKAQGYVASLLSQQRPNIFTQSVANIEPQKRIDIEISYFHTLRLVDGEYEFVFPMVVGPRFNPKGTTQGVGAVGRGKTGASGQQTEIEYLKPTELSEHDISLSVKLDAGMAVKGIKSPSHSIDIRDRNISKGRATISLARGEGIPNKDFILRYEPDADRAGAGLMTHVDEEGNGYFTLLLQPPSDLEKIPQMAREMVFVLDCSGSMNGEPIAACKRSVRRCLRRLDPNDTFQIIRFSDHASPMGPRPVPATRANVRKGLAYVDGLEANGGTMMINGIRASLGGKKDSERNRIVSFMTDGYIGNEAEILTEVKRNVGDARIFSFGVGNSVNRYLLERMAQLGRGAAAYVSLDDSSARAVDGLYRRLERPALTGIEIDWGGLEVSDVQPAAMPDLFVGRPIVVTGRFKGKTARSIRVKGRFGGKAAWHTELKADFAAAENHPALAKLWARAKIAGLHNRMVGGEPPDELIPKIRTIALHHGLVSRYTSFVAVDSLARTEGDRGTTVRVPVPVPEGVQYSTAVDKD